MENRRQVKSRNNNIFHKLSRGLVSIGLKPNHISVMSFVFALLGGYGFYLISINQIILGSILSLIGIQLRLICNLIDGLMAVEGKLSSPQGELYNDIPDRFSDWALIVSCGFVLQSHPYGWHLVWGATVLAIMTAYIRVLGASQGVGHDFGGPMAKQHRMAILNLALIGSIVESILYDKITGISIAVGIIIIALGSALTSILRCFRIAKALGEKNQA